MDIEKHEVDQAPEIENTVAVAPVVTPMMQWAMEARQVAAIAQSLARTSFVPKQYQGRPEEITAAIMAGQEIGMQPIASLRAINVIQGTPSLTASAMRGLVQSHGHEVWVEESNETRAIVWGRRKGESTIQESKWTTDRAKKLGLLHKDNWQNQPQAMLIARATSECCRLVASDVLLGMPYSQEELQDLAEANEAKPAKRKTAKRRTVQRSTPVAPEPELEAPEPDSMDVDDNVEEADDAED